MDIEGYRRIQDAVDRGVTITLPSGDEDLRFLGIQIESYRTDGQSPEPGLPGVEINSDRPEDILNKLGKAGLLATDDDDGPSEGPRLRYVDTYTIEPTVLDNKPRQVVMFEDLNAPLN